MATVEWLAHEYRIPFPEAVWEFPLILAILMLPVRNERNGGETGPSYATTAAINARNKAREWLKQNYDLTEKPLSETGWVLG